MRIALVGMKELPEPDHDEAPLLAALHKAGADARVLHWDDATDPCHDPAQFDVCVLRATWDYFKRPEQFTAWLKRAAELTVLLNPLAAVQWNMHKRYLLELADLGIPVIPTTLLEQGSPVPPSDGLLTPGEGDVVIKPAISAASWKTRCFSANERDSAASFLREEVARRDMLVQPFIQEVTTGGELSIIWIDGDVTHIIRKAPRFHGSEESISACDMLDRRHVAFAQQVVEAARQEVVYARIDIVERVDGSILLSELELIEPSLYFPYSALALDRFARAITRIGSEDAASPSRSTVRES